MDDEKKMDLNAIDQPAWFRIIHFLDNKSRLQCRMLSSTIKSYVDYMGLHLRVDDLGVLESPNKEAWESFLDTPELYFKKLHISASGDYTTPVNLLDLVVQQQLEYLKFSGRVNLNWFLNLKWTSKLVQLTFHGTALDVQLFNDVQNVDLYNFSRLKTLYLSSKTSTAAKNTAKLLKKIRNNCLKSTYIELHVKHRSSLSNLCNIALAELIQAHGTTLNALSYYNNYPFVDWTSLPDVKFTSIPYGLHHLNLDFIGECDSDSPWHTMLSSLNQLEDFFCQPNLSHKDYEADSDLIPGMTKTICENNFATLKYLSVYTTHIHSNEFDLGIVGCCTQLEYLYFEVKEIRNLRNLLQLPASLRVLNIMFYNEEPRLILNMEEVTRIQKFKNLTAFTISPSVQLQSYDLLFAFSRAMLRLPKLDFIELDEINVAESYCDNMKLCQDLFEELTYSETQLVEEDAYFCGSEMCMTLLWRIPKSRMETEEGESADFKCEAYEASSKTLRLWEEIEGTYRKPKIILPSINETRFRISTLDD